MTPYCVDDYIYILFAFCMVIIDFSIVYHLNLITVPKLNILAGLWVNRMLKQC